MTIYNGNFWPYDSTELVTIRTADTALEFLNQYPYEPSGLVTNLVDFDNSIAIVLMRGGRPNTNYYVTINRVERSGDILRVFATESGHTFGSRAVRFPTQIVRVDLTGLDVELAEIRLECDGVSATPESSCF